MNKKWAECAYTQKDYDVAVNRYYYSIFQQLLHILSDKRIKTNRISGEGSHNATAAAYANHFFNGDFKKRTRFNKSFQSLKTIRCEADYNESQVNSFRANEAKTAYNDINMLIKK